MLPSPPVAGNYAGVFAPLPGPAVASRWRSARWWIALGLAAFAGCLLPAALNGYPAAFADVTNYLIAARDFRPTAERAFGYGAFLRVSGAFVSFWLPAAAQSALAAYLAVRFLSLEAPTWPARWRPHALAALTAALLAGHLPWQTSFVMPDVFAGIMLLALLLLAEHREGLPGWERAFVAALLAGAATMHLTHPPLLLGLAAVAGAVAFLPRLRARGPSAAATPPLPKARRAATLALAAAVLG